MPITWTDVETTGMEPPTRYCRGREIRDTCTTDYTRHCPQMHRAPHTEFAINAERTGDGEFTHTTRQAFRDGHYEKVCGYPNCWDCYPRPGDGLRWHSIGYDAYDLRRGDIPWRSRKLPCNDRDCEICHPTWTLSLVELSARRQREVADRRAEERRKRRREYLDTIQEESEKKAVALLKEVVTPEQWRTYEREGYIPVTGSEGGEYEIRHGYSGNIDVVNCTVPGYLVTDRENDNTYHARRCAHPEMSGSVELPDDLGDTYMEMPYEDAMYCQYLMIVTDEKAFLRVSNSY